MTYATALTPPLRFPWIGPLVCAITWGLVFSIHLANGFSAEISLYILDSFLLAWGLLFIRHIPPPQVIALAGAMVALVFLRPFTHLSLTLSILPAAGFFLAYFSMGRLLAMERRYRTAYTAVVIACALLNVLANGIQYLGLDNLYYWPFFFRSAEGPGGRTIGILGHSNHIGFFLVIAIFLLAQVWSERAQSLQNISKLRLWITHATWGGLYLVLVLGAASTRSRTTLACAAIGAVFWLWSRRTRPAWMTLALIGFPALLLGAEWLWRLAWDVLHVVSYSINPLGKGAEHSLKLLSTEHPRLGLWSHALAIIAERPWLGWGWKQTRLGLLESFPDVPHFELFDHSHNLFLELAIYFGIPVSVSAFLGICFLVFKFKPWREVRPDRITAWLILTCIFAYSQVEFPLWYLHFISLAAMAAGYLWWNPALLVTPAPHPFKLGYRIVAVVLGLTLSVAAFVDYQLASRAYSRSYLWPAQRPGQVTTEEMLAAQQTVLFGPFTGYALVLQPTDIQLTDEQIVYFGEYALATAPEPALLFKLIAAHQRLGHKDRARQLAEQGLRQFPKDFRTAKSRAASGVVK
jgi:O-antigen ligase